MLTEKDLLSKFSELGTASGVELYLSVVDSCTLIQECEDNNLAVIGVEGFHRLGESLYPDMSMIADYSSIESENWLEYRSECNRQSLEMLKKINKQNDLLFNFTLLSESDWYRMRVEDG